MKKVFIALLSVLAVVSCGKEDVVEPEVFDILAEVGDLPNSAGTIDVQISTDYTDFEVVMATSESWVTFVETKSSLPVEEKVLTFSYTANPAMSVRQEAAKIVAGGLTLGEIVFTQKAGLPCVFKAPELDKLPYIKGSQEIKISYDYPEVTVEVDADWLKVEAAPEAKGEVDVVEHSYLLSYETALTREERTAKVTFKAGEEVVGQFDVVQSAFGGAIILEKVYSRYSNGTNAWCSFIPGIANRTMASDGKYVYLQSSEGTAKIYAIEIASLLKSDETPVYKALSTANMGGGTHAVSALRCIPNEAGDPVLIATNLAVDGSQNFNIYAYSNGTDKDPVLFHAYRYDGVANTSDWRRYGDRISVSGTWQKGSIWAPSQSATKVMVFHIENGATDSGHREYCWFDGMPGALSEATLYPGAADAPAPCGL